MWFAGTETVVSALLFVVEWEMLGIVGLAFEALFGPLEIFVVVALQDEAEQLSVVAAIGP